MLVDDGSTDDTVKIAEDYERRDSRIRLVSKGKNLGLVQNWNRCVKLAQGDWIKFLFQDDLLDSSCLTRMLEAGNKGVDLVVCRRNLLFEPGCSQEIREFYTRYVRNHNLPLYFPDQERIPSESFAEIVVDFPIYNCIGEPTATLVRRSVFDRFGYFNQNLVSLCDWEFFARVAIHSGISYVNDTLATLRVHERAASVLHRYQRPYLANVIDPLIVRHDIAYKPVFKSVRTAVLHRSPPINLRHDLVYGAREARAVVGEFSADPVCPDPGALDAWRDAVRRYPRLRLVPPSFIAGWGRRRLNSIRQCLVERSEGRICRVPFDAKINGANFETGLSVPVIICVDIEPDEFFIERDLPRSWAGYEKAYWYFRSLRPRLVALTGNSVHYLWSIRMDPQIAETYGSSLWGTRQYAEFLQDCTEQGDMVGLHTHAYRWDKNLDSWVIDHGNQRWVEHCVRTAFQSFEAAFGYCCESFRFGDHWLNDQTVRLVENFGARFDLTLEPGQMSQPTAHPGNPFTGSLPDLTGVPRFPYRPSAADFRKPDRSRKEGIWLIPLSAVTVVRSRQRNSRLANLLLGHQSEFMPRTLNLTVNSQLLVAAIERLLAGSKRPYLALPVRTDGWLKPDQLKSITETFEHILSHSAYEKLRFATPPEALSLLGFQPGKSVSPRLSFAPQQSEVRAAVI